MMAATDADVEAVWCRKCRRYVPVAEFRRDADADLIAEFHERTRMKTTIAGSQVTAAFITPGCRLNRGDDGAWDEAVARLRVHYEAVVNGWAGQSQQPTLNLLLTMERP